MKIKFSKRLVLGILGPVIFIVVAFLLKAPAALENAAVSCGCTGSQAMAVLGSLAWAICWWAGMVLPDWQVALILQCVWLLAAKLKFTSVFAAYSGTTIWLVVGIFCLSAAITKTGLLKRISYQLMRLFPATFRGQAAAMMAVGTICSPLIPSTTAKVLLGSRLADSSSTLMKYDSFSRGRSGLFVAALTGFELTAPLFLTGSFLAYSMLGALPEAYGSMSWIQWFVAMLPWGIVILVGMFLVVMLFYRPEKSETFSKEYINEQCASLGKISKNEKITAVITGVCLIFWILEKATGISSGIVAIVGALACFITGVLDKKEFNSAVPWSFVVFLGVVLNVGDIFVSTGISDWLVELVGPVLSLVSSPMLIVCAAFIVTLAVRFVLTSQAAVIALFSSVFAPIAISMGINPVITGLVVYSIIPVWVVVYQNVTYLAALEAMNGTLEHSNTVKGAVGFVIVAFVAVIISVPWWSMLGYIG